MALTEQTVIDQITIDNYGRVFYRERTDVIKDGEVIAFTYHRTTIEPSDDLKGHPDRVAAIAKVGRKDAQPLPE